MSRDEVMRILGDVFKMEFNDEDSIILDETTSDDIEEWDSVENIYLIDAIEERFGITLQIEETSKLNNVGELVDMIYEIVSGE